MLQTPYIRIHKTKIFGVGRWKNRQQWPLDWLKSESEFMFTLGIWHGNDYNNTLDKNWSLVTSKIQIHVNMLHTRRISLFQRAAYANSCILSKVWYISHIYPLPGLHAKILMVYYLDMYGVGVMNLSVEQLCLSQSK